MFSLRRTNALKVLARSDKYLAVLCSVLLFHFFDYLLDELLRQIVE